MSSANSHNENQSDNLKRELESLLNNIRNKKTDGVKELRILYEKYPNNIEIIGHLAWCLALIRNYQESIDFYKKYLTIQPNCAEVQWRIADRLINLGKLDEALAQYNLALINKPDCMDSKIGIRYINYLKKVGLKNSQKLSFKQTEQSELKKHNLKINKEEFEKQKINLASLPPNLFLESTTKCNFYCRTCLKGYGPYYAEDLRDEIFEKIKKELMPVNCRNLLTGFGEPMLSRNFDDVMKYSLENGSEVHFVTNASLLNFKRLESLLKFPVTIVISMDGATKETFESVRDGSNFDMICDKLAMIKKLRDIYLSEVSAKFSINFVALRNNIHELPDLVRLAHQYGILSIAVADYNLGLRDFDKQSLRYDPIMANRYFEEAKKLSIELGVNVSFPPPYVEEILTSSNPNLLNKIKNIKRIFSISKRFPKHCYSPWSEPYIHTNGIVSPCCITMKSFGDLKKKSFKKIWNGWRYKLLRLRIQSTFPPLYCRNCSVNWGINEGNAGNVKSKEGLIIKILYHCEFHLPLYIYKLKNLFKKLSDKLFGIKPLSSAPPNYFKGRPMKISDSNNPVNLNNKIVLK